VQPGSARYVYEPLGTVLIIGLAIWRAPASAPPECRGWAERLDDLERHLNSTPDRQ